MVARKGPLVVIAEVRTRGSGSFVGPLASITPTKRRHLVLAADRLWRTQLARDLSVERLRIDVAAVVFEGGRTYVEYLPGAVVGL